MKASPFIILLLSITQLFAQSTRQYADSVRVANGIPELSYAVVNGNEILEIVALGKHSVLLQDTATLQDRFHLASNTKAMTAYLIALQVEKGKMHWDDRFFDYFPEWKASSRPEYHAITVADLLSHRARIQSFRGDNDPEIPDIPGDKQARRKAFGEFVLNLDPAVLDAEHPFVYSNAGYTLASLMLEKATHKSWEQLVEKTFNKKLKLSIGFSWPENQTQKDTWGHYAEGDSLIPVPSTSDYHLDFTEPAGDLNATLPDYIRFIQLLLNGWQGKDKHLSQANYQFLLAGREDYAMGWYNVTENGIGWSSHAGTVGTYYTMCHIDRDAGFAYIVFTNAFNSGTQNGVKLVMRKLKENY